MVPMTFHKKKTELKARHMARCFEFMFTRNVMKRDVGLQQVKSSPLDLDPESYKGEEFVCTYPPSFLPVVCEHVDPNLRSKSANKSPQLDFSELLCDLRINSYETIKIN